MGYGKYDPEVHSKGRLGMIGSVPLAPMMPEAAQLEPRTGRIHLRFMEGVYVTAMCPSVAPGKLKGVILAAKGAGTEPSYSGSGSPYVPLTVTPDPDGRGATLTIGIGVGGVIVGRVIVDTAAEIVSLDEPIGEQIMGGLKENEEGDEHNPPSPPDKGVH